MQMVCTIVALYYNSNKAYQRITFVLPKKNIKVTLIYFKQEVARSILESCFPTTLATKTKHHLQKASPARTSSKRCHLCYETIKKNENTKLARKKAKQINTQCSSCNIHFYLQCFSKAHKICHT